MKNFMVLARAVDYIETNLCEPFSRSEVAAHCYVSLSLLEKLFRRALGMGLRDYTEKRRMTQAAKALVLAECTATELAMRFQFSSAEVFSRAFKRVWRVNPSEFKEHWKFTGIFPKITCDWKEGEDWQMARKRVDLSEAYDFLKPERAPMSSVLT